MALFCITIGITSRSGVSYRQKKHADKQDGIDWEFHDPMWATLRYVCRQFFVFFGTIRWDEFDEGVEANHG